MDWCRFKRSSSRFWPSSRTTSASPQDSRQSKQNFIIRLLRNRPLCRTQPVQEFREARPPLFHREIQTARRRCSLLGQSLGGARDKSEYLWRLRFLKLKSWRFPPVILLPSFYYAKEGVAIKKTRPCPRGNSRKEANTFWKEVAFKRVLLYNELIDKSGFGRISIC